MTSPDSDSIGGGNGDGGALGTPSQDTKEAPPSQDQDTNMVVSGGGVADTEAEEGS